MLALAGAQRVKAFGISSMVTPYQVLRTLVRNPEVAKTLPKLGIGGRRNFLVYFSVEIFI